MSGDKTNLAYWFPLLEVAGLPVPKTTMLALPLDALEDLYRVFDGEKPTGLAEPFFVEVESAADALGYPCFLRTGYTSGKHDWRNTCFLKSAADIRSHVVAIIEYSELTSMMGLSCTTWVVRELLPTIPFGECEDYGGMPICREFRFFVDDGVVRCSHPYWPQYALEQGGADKALDFEALCRMDNEAELSALASAAGKAVGGSWSVDLLETKRGWFITDMAEAHKSFHWEGCQKATPWVVNQIPTEIEP